MVRKGKGWLLSGFAYNEETAKAKAEELKPKGFEVSINKTTKTYRNKNWNASQGPYKDLTKTVFNVWTRDTMSWHTYYKTNGQRRF